MSRRLRRWVLVCGALMLAGCVAIPLSTMWKLRDLTVDSFFQSDPAQLRVAVLAERAMKRGAGLPKLTADLRLAGKPPFCYVFALAPVEPAVRNELPLEKAAPNRVWSAFAVSPAGIDAFKRARRDVAGIAKGTEARFTIGVSTVDFLDLGDDRKSFSIRIDVAVNREDGYFTLIKETSVDVQKPVAFGKSEATKPVAADACPP